MTVNLDLNNPKDARIFIAEVRFDGEKPSYVDVSSGKRVYLNSMTDAEAVFIANEFFTMLKERHMH